MNVAIIPAGGQGRRMQSTLRKQFLELAGLPIIVHTLRAFELCSDVEAVILVLPSEDLLIGQKLLDEHNLQKVLPPISGAAERQGSVYCGLQAAERFFGSNIDICVIHDGVRPLVTPPQISQTIAAAKLHRAAICATPVTDTIKRIDADKMIVATIDRTNLYLAQTPQAFDFSLILTAHRLAETAGIKATDDASLVERLGFKVAVVIGSAFNIKITRQEDLNLAEFILKSRESQN
ncbi:MAG: 2-C-methyl-D-erythritol 4-phosphate cytidylyltransferase [Acidobacteriota bacterium]|nr:2-C-methyl-D-erythritol 4-phosphate cytidylyltransferase [Blastocatellia bacterium]MDW8412513.1 2-C-methyl-D-erythritol 4-phosphate cytidylyltransferase [Acidobacteriota bacterium]